MKGFLTATTAYHTIFLCCLLSACANESHEFETVFPQQDESCNAEWIQSQYLVRWKDGHTSIEKAYDRASLIETFLKDNIDQIELVEQDQFLSLETGIFPEESHRKDEGSWALERIEAQAAWDEHVTGENVIVAVIDSGLDLTHPQLQNQIALNENEIPDNAIDDDHNGYVDDIQGWDFLHDSPHVVDRLGHGTHVSGIILADPSKGSAKGVAPRAKVLPLSFMDESGSGRLSDVIRAINYAVDRGAHIINASWGGSFCSTALKTAIYKLETQGVLFITAAGNSHLDIDVQPEYPAAFDLANQITVGASNSTDQQALFSNLGVKSVHLVAPGTEILSTFPYNSLRTKTGTSMAAPFVTGTAALLWSSNSLLPIDPMTRAKRVRQAILNSVDIGPYEVQTSGRLNVARALQRFEELSLPSPSN